MTRICFISGGDFNYYHLLLEWCHSLRRFPQSQGCDIGIFDAGMTEEQTAHLTQAGYIVKKPDWPIPLPASKTQGREFLKACVARPFIPDYFPGYDLYIWMDSDTWIQDWSAIEMMIAGANKHHIALTAQVDRAYPRATRIKWLGRWPWKVRNFYFSNANKAFGFDIAKQLLSRHVLLAGAFALHKDAPHWLRWQTLLKRALLKGNLFTAEQLTLGILCHLEGYKAEILPAYAHWLCEFPPLWDEERKIFVEPFIPHQPLGILHLSGVDEMRRRRDATIKIQTLNGADIEVSYRYPHDAGGP
jgi:hypothetical protein